VGEKEARMDTTPSLFEEKRFYSKNKEEGTFICIYCGFQTFIKNYLKVHEKSKHYISHETSPTDDLLNRHESKKSQNKSSGTNQDLEQNRNKPLSDDVQIEARFEKRVFESYEEITFGRSELMDKKTSLDTNNDAKVGFKCGSSECEFETFQREEINQHNKIEKHTGVTFFCVQCSLTSNSYQSVTRHFESVHGGQRYNCTHCDYKARYAHDLKPHMKSQHTSIKCELCDFEATKKTALKAHTKFAHIEGVHEEQMHKCSICDYKTIILRHLTTHMKSQHTSMRCNLCDFVAIKKTALNAHFYSTHTRLAFI